MKYTTGTDPNLHFLDESISVQTEITSYYAKRHFTELTTDGLLTLSCDFRWREMKIVQADPACVRATAVHYALCTLILMDLLSASMRPVIDKLYYNLCREDGMSWLQAKLRWACLRVYGITTNIG